MISMMRTVQIQTGEHTTTTTRGFHWGPSAMGFVRQWLPGVSNERGNHLDGWNINQQFLSIISQHH